tara:strand:- start:522 stop:731 length:210 start_codon:yes stop_codon:yes gene_type:complete
MTDWARGLNKEQSAKYLGISETLFSELVKNKQIHQGYRISAGRVIYDRFRLDELFNTLAENEVGNVKLK